jgi:hypothetical protein
MDAKKLKELGDELFGKKQPLNSLHQEIADNFYYERANFTIQRSLGTDFASNSMTSYPAMCRRDLGNQFGTMLRPTAKPWFHTGIRHASKVDIETRQFLQAFEETQRRAMYDPASKFTRATKEGDHDFAAFGQCAISIELNRMANGLLYRCWHLRDMAWQENEEGDVGARFRKWKPTAQTAYRTFGKDKLHAQILKYNDSAPFTDVDLMHIVVEGDMYDEKTSRPWWSIWYDVSHECLIEAVPSWTGVYRIPRWQTVSGSQYSYSPATVAALPDARVIQAMTFSLLEAGEKATNPPMVATIDAVRSDMAMYAGGVTWVDPEYDEKLGEAVRPIAQDFRGFNFGIEMNQDVRQLINAAFYLNKLTMPQRGPDMTAYEVSQRVQQYIRDALPIFEPMEQDYNAGLCDDSFELLWRNGAFGSPLDWPKSLRNAEIDFTFESPLHDAIEEQKGQLFVHGQQLTAAAMQVDPSVGVLIDGRAALRGALTGIGYPAEWMHTDSQVESIDAARAQQEQAAKQLEAMTQAGAATKDFAAAQASMAQAQPVAMAA